MTALGTASQYLTDDARWEAMRRRDRDLDGAFFIAVRTTGVYCLASCAGRPLRKNVEFHDTQASARAAGFRPCLRCKPDQPRETLRYATVATSLGLALVARSEAGLRLVTLGDEAAALVRDLERRFRSARLTSDPDGLQAELRAVAVEIDGRGAALDLPLDAQGTTCNGRSGRRCGPYRPGPPPPMPRWRGPSAGRPPPGPWPRPAGPIRWRCSPPATGWCGPTAGLSGYRWGVERKAALLAREAA
jgi:AraC family transcriptional regulator of adaptative response/methylated-DNA-[protein]-cysteine methyltransferase